MAAKKSTLTKTGSKANGANASQKKTAAKAAGASGAEEAKGVAKARKPPEKSAAPHVSAKKVPAKKATAKKASSRKAAASKAPETNTVVSSVSAAAKRIQEREARRKKRASERLAEKVPVKKAPAVKTNGTASSKVKPLTKRDLEKFKNLLLELRDRIVGDIEFLTTDNLHRVGRDTGADLSGASQHSADHGTDNFDREFALSLATSEQDVLYEVDEALMRIQEGTYGVCEMTGVRIEKARLEVIPYTRYSVQAQAKMEQGRAKYRPFAQAFKSW